MPNDIVQESKMTSKLFLTSHNPPITIYPLKIDLSLRLLHNNDVVMTTYVLLLYYLPTRLTFLSHY